LQVKRSFAVFLVFYAVTDGLGGSTWPEFVPRRAKPEVCHCLKCRLIFAKCFHIFCCKLLL